MGSPAAPPTEAIAASVTEWLRPNRELPRHRGVPCQQFPADLDRYRQIIRELKPPFIIEIGRAEGGTALLLADDLCDARPDGLVVSIDVAGWSQRHDRIRYVQASSTHEDAVRAAFEVAAGRRGLVLLDGDHSSAHVAHELALYADLADYLIVEDTIMRYLPGNEDGPHRALDVWLPQHPEFIPDPDPELTQHPGGWLRRNP